MSVGESDGSDEYEDEEEFGDDPRQQNVAAQKGTYESPQTHHQQQQQQQRLGRAGGAEPFIVMNQFNQNGNSSRDVSMNSYYTTLLTGIKAGQADSSFSAEQSLKQTLSDAVSGELMDDAVIFPCGHSFGNAGVQKVQETSLCPTCQVPTRCRDGTLNLALRAAVQAYRLDRECPKSGSSRAAKRRRDSDGEQDGGRPKGVQFPYVVSDKVLIKGNKRTPERFVGKQAIITTQCLNGWYLVRTIDNGESVRLQYRSLQKIEG